MTDKVYHSFSRTYRSRAAATAIQYASGSDGWVVPSTQRLMADPEGDLATGALNAFAESHSASSFDVTIDTGEALVGGAYLARDTTTTVTLASSTTGQTVYVGWGDSQTDTVIVGTSGAFGSDDRKLAAWTFDTDGSGVTSVTDEREFQQLRAGNLKKGANIVDDGTGAVAVNGGQGSGLNADTLRTRTAAELAAFHYGDGDDGAITRSTNGNENGLIQATDYSIDAGVTRTPTTGILVILATNSVTIDGTIDASGQGGSGGAGGSATGGDGAVGDGGVLVPLGTGGSGGSGASSSAGTGGDGGDGDTYSPKRVELMDYKTPYLDARKPSVGPGAGGGGGGASDSEASSSAASGSNGSAPGGGGGGAEADNTSGDGGAGGAGGGFVYIAAPEITVTGTITVAGADGSAAPSGGGGGGGGGGSGGAIVLAAPTLDTSSATLSAAGGAGGAGAGDGSGNTGGDGASGATGKIYERVIR